MAYTQEEKKEYAINASKDLRSSVENFLVQCMGKKTDIEKLSNHYNYTNSLYKYSFYNTCLILAQGGKLCQSFENWKKLKRFVKKGVKSNIKIFVPMFKRDKETEDTKLIGFTIGSVFDIDQTDGEDLQFKNNTVFNDIDFETVVSKVKSLVPQSIQVDVMSEARGYVTDTNIVINKSSSNGDKIKTLFHEIGHSLFKHVGSDKERGTKEIEAEAVAYFAMSALGVNYDMSEEYISSWAEGKNIKGIDVSGIVKNAEKIILAIKGE
jgi:antirestriction protein ArdC